jgi:hypothetical protein
LKTSSVLCGAQPAEEVVDEEAICKTARTTSRVAAVTLTDKILPGLTVVAESVVVFNAVPLAL